MYTSVLGHGLLGREHHGKQETSQETTMGLRVEEAWRVVAMVMSVNLLDLYIPQL